MAPHKKRKSIETLENLCLKTVLSSVIADLYLTHLMKNDLRLSLLLTPLRNQSSKELIRQTSLRLQILPGLLNDEVRIKLINEFYSTKERNDFDKFPAIGVDLLKVLLNETVTNLDLGCRRLPKQALAIIADKCPNLKSLKIIISEPDYSQESDNESVDSLDLTRKRLSFRSWRKSQSEFVEDMQPCRKRIKISTNKISKIIQRVNPYMNVSMSFQHMTHVSVTFGACNNLMMELGQNANLLQKLQINNSYCVNDVGVKKLCLKNPDNHSQRTDSQLHELRVRSFHLNPCCRSLRELEIVGTCISHYGVAFLLKYIPHLKSLGDCGVITEALEILVGNKLHNRALPTIKGHPTRYKLSRMKEERVTSQKFFLLTSLCPYLSELQIGHSFREVDLGGSLDSLLHGKGLSGQIGQLQHLKTLSIFNIRSVSVQEAIRAVGSQLASLRVYCKGLDVPVILSTCVNLSTLTLEGSSASAPYEALESLRSKALKKLEVVKIRSILPTAYIDLILCSSSILREIDISNLGEVSDNRIECLVVDGYFKYLTSFCVKKAPYLTVKAASILVVKCPKLGELKDLGGWNITNVQYYKLERELQEYDIRLHFGSYLHRDTDSDNSSVESDYASNLFDAFRNIFPVVIL